MKLHNVHISLAKIIYVSKNYHVFAEGIQFIFHFLAQGIAMKYLGIYLVYLIIKISDTLFKIQLRGLQWSSGEYILSICLIDIYLYLMYQYIQYMIDISDKDIYVPAEGIAMKQWGIYLVAVAFGASSSALLITRLWISMSWIPWWQRCIFLQKSIFLHEPQKWPCTRLQGHLVPG